MPAIAPCHEGANAGRHNDAPKLVLALARWEGEGGATRQASRGRCDDLYALSVDEERVLRNLGAAVIDQWNDLPMPIQRRLFARATAMGNPLGPAQSKQQIARFIHKHKDAFRDLTCSPEIPPRDS